MLFTAELFVESCVSRVVSNSIEWIGRVRSRVWACRVLQCYGDRPTAARWQQIHARCLMSLRWCGEYVLTWLASRTQSLRMKHTCRKCRSGVKHLPSTHPNSQVWLSWPTGLHITLADLLVWCRYNVWIVFSATSSSRQQLQCCSS